MPAISYLCAAAAAEELQLAAMAERFDDVCELEELSGGDYDCLGEPSPKRAKYTGYS